MYGNSYDSGIWTLMYGSTYDNGIWTLMYGSSYENKICGSDSYANESDMCVVMVGM